MGLVVAVIGGSDEAVRIIANGVQLQVSISLRAHSDGDVVHRFWVQEKNFKVVSELEFEHRFTSCNVAFFGINLEFLEESIWTIAFHVSASAGPFGQEILAVNLKADSIVEDILSSLSVAG